MKAPLDKDLNNAYEAFNKDHERLRESLMGSLPDRLPAKTIHISIRKFIGDAIMRSRITKLAAAAVIIIAVALLITFLDKAVTPAYAIEQTIKAYDGISYLHFYYYPCTVQKIGREAWIQYDENGNVDTLRVNLHNYYGENTTVKEVWSKGTTLIWSSHKNTLEIDESGYYTPMMLNFAERFAPRHAIEHLYKNQQEGRCQIEIQEGSNENEPIRITARYFPGEYFTYPRGKNVIHDVFLVDPKTKLVTQIEVYTPSEDHMELHGVYKDYDSQPFDPNIFDIEKEIPDDAIQVVHYSVDDVNEVGIDEGSLSPEEAHHVVIEEFFNALIAKDYKEAGLLFGGMPTDEVELMFGKLNVVRVVSIGERVKAQDRFLPSYYPCVVEIKENGKLSQWQPNVHIGKVIPHNINRWRIMAVF